MGSFVFLPFGFMIIVAMVACMYEYTDWKQALAIPFIPILGPSIGIYVYLKDGDTERSDQLSAVSNALLFILEDVPQLVIMLANLMLLEHAKEKLNMELLWPLLTIFFATFRVWSFVSAAYKKGT